MMNLVPIISTIILIVAVLGLALVGAVVYWLVKRPRTPRLATPPLLDGATPLHPGNR